MNRIWRVRAVVAIICGLVLALDVALPLGVAAGVPYVAAVLFSLWPNDRRLVVHTAVAASLLTGIGALLSPAGGIMWVVITNRVLALGAIWVAAAMGLLRMTAEDARRSEFAKDLLLREVHHRVKNNLGVINSIIYLQRSRSDSDEVNAVLAKTSDRVRAIALVHETLHQPETAGDLPIRDYLEQLTTGLQAAGPLGVTIHCDADETLIPFDLTLPCGLIVNELVTNAMQHAYPDGSTGDIRVRFRAENGSASLTVADDGVGYSSDAPVSAQGLGSRIVAALVDQIEGELKTQESNGTRVVLTFPMGGLPGSEAA